MADTERVKLFLNQYRMARADVRRIDAEIEQLHDELLGTNVNTVTVTRVNRDGVTITEEHVMDRVQTSGTGDPTGKIATRIADATETANERRLIALEAMRCVSGAINMVDDHRLRDLLHRRYIECQKWETVAEGMNYEVRYLLKLHGKALKEVGKILNRT